MHPDAETSAPVLRARRAAALARCAIGLSGLALVLAHPSLSVHPVLALVAFAFALFTAVAQRLVMGDRWYRLEEALAVPAVLLIGFGDQRINVLALLWLAGAGCGVLARAGRLRRASKLTVLGSLVLPVALAQRLSLPYAVFCIGALCLLRTCSLVTHELRALLARARWDADHDTLTGALAPTAFRERVDAATPHHREGSLLLIDLDNFSQINKTGGHAVGDQVLTHVGAVLRELAGDQAIVGRLGGDEFGIATPGPDAHGLATRIVAELDGTVPASIGMAAFPDDGDNAETLLRAADIALRIAKRGGRQQISAYAGDSLSDHGPQGARASLARLVAGEDLAIFVQPIVNVQTGRCHGFEALARFHTGSTSSPLHWFELADEFGKRAELELACLRAALTLLDELPPDTSLSVNLSGGLLLDPRTLALFMDVEDLSNLVVELTEDTLVEDTPELRAALREMRLRGIQLAVDDMGAGYSGLRQITTVQATYLKLDRSLITGIEDSQERQALIAALLSYAQRVNGLLVAEGVETEAELRTLRELGVPLVQGYLLGRPAKPWPDTPVPVAAVQLPPVA